MSTPAQQVYLPANYVIMCPCCRQIICLRCAQMWEVCDRLSAGADGASRQERRRAGKRLQAHQQQYDHRGIAGLERPGTHGITVEAHLGALARIRELEALVAALRGEGGQA